MRRQRRTASMLAGLALGAIAVAGAAWAETQPSEMLPNPALEARSRNIGKELRCLVRQNEFIEDSDADLAHDLRVLVRQRVLAGDFDAQVKQYIVARYGNFVLLKPPLIPETYLLWFGPLLLAGCAVGAATVFYRRARPVENAPLSADQARRLAALIGENEADKAEG